MTATPPLVDTNILVYLFDLDRPEKRECAKTLIEECFSGRRPLSVSVQNLAEFSVVVTENVEYPLPGETVSRFVHDICNFSGWNVIGYDGCCISDAVGLGAIHHLHFWDALLLATMKRHGITTIYSEDEHFSKVAGIRAVNPFVRT